MAQRYNILVSGTTGSNKLPVTSTDIYYNSPVMGADSDKVDVYLEFFDAAGNPVTPTAGQVFVYGLPVAQNWLPAVGSPVNATAVSAGISAYVPPMMDGLCTQARVRFVGIQGAATASAVVYKR